MDIYNCRDKAIYDYPEANPSYAENSYILKWWTPSHDNIIIKQIKYLHWVWYWGITDELIKITDAFIIEEWKKKDPICKNYAWYNILMYFAIARAKKHNFLKYIKKARWKICPLCNQEFVENSIPYPLIERIGIANLDFCSPCLTEALLNPGDSSLSLEATTKYLNNLTDLINRIPSQNFGLGKKDVCIVDKKYRKSLLQLLQKKPTIDRVKSLFGSWFNALIKVGILENGTRKTSRGIQCLAKDGHMCLSLGEKTIDDILFDNKISHKKEPKYPECNYRGDFKVNNIFIEFFGLKGNPEYDKKTDDKINICKKYEIKLLAIYPEDLINQEELEKKLLSVK